MTDQIRVVSFFVMPSTLVTAPAGAPAPSKGERTRARILAAAAEHFAEVGLQGGSVPEIARRTGVSHAAVYQHFGRKEQLFRTAVEADLTALFDDLGPAIDRGPLHPEVVVELLGALVAAGRRRPLARRVIADLDAEQTEVLRDLPALATLEARLVPGLALAQQAGTVRPDVDAASLAAGLVAVALPLLVVAFRLDGATDIPRAAGALEFLVAVLRPPTDPTNRRTTS